MNSTFKTALLWASLFVLMLAAWNFSSIQKKDTPVNFSDFMAQVEAGSIKEVTVDGNEIRGKRTSGDAFKTIVPFGYDKPLDALLAKKVQVSVINDQAPTFTTISSNSATSTSRPLVLTVYVNSVPDGAGGAPI